jgi:RHS repeat-associated protein
MRPKMFAVLALLLGWASGATAQTVPAGVVEYYHVDALGSVRAVTSAAGAVVRMHHYHPFGEGVETGADPMRFTGKPRDAGTGLDYFGARYYASRTGRFTTVDPMLDVEQALVDPQRWNRYAYSLNNPLKFVDPDGKNPLLVMGGAGAAVFGGWQVYQNLRQGRPWHENVGVEASKGLIIGATLGLAAPAIAGTTAAEMGVLATAGSAGAAANALGVARETYVAQLVGGRVAGDVRITIQGVGSTAIDVFGKAGEFIGVGGPAKGLDLSELGTKLKVLAGAAEQAGVKAQYYFARGSSIEAFRLAERGLGKGNVHWYELPQ